jgi:3-oxoacyl-[acyl-carrier-protein] synthase II
MAHGLKGPSYCTTSACSSGAHAVGEAAEWIRRGKVDVMIAGGSEATITPVGIAGFEAMLALSKRNDDPQRASRPFDLGRDGFVCGEGAGILVLESLARERAARRSCGGDRVWRVDRRLSHHPARADTEGRRAMRGYGTRVSPDAVAT